jgi:hypothetical protein
MSYIDYSQPLAANQKVLEQGDYVYYGRTDAEHGKPTAVASMPAQFQTSYTTGYTLGTYYRYFLTRNQL